MIADRYLLVQNQKVEMHWKNYEIFYTMTAVTYMYPTVNRLIELSNELRIWVLVLSKVYLEIHRRKLIAVFTHSLCSVLDLISQDDLEFMALHGILNCFKNDTKFFGGVTCTNGAGSARSGPYACFTDEEMKNIRRQEQRAAAQIGGYSFMVQLNHPSKHAKRASCRDVLVDDIVLLLEKAQPRIVYTHNPFDKHSSHVGVLLATLEAIQKLPVERRPEHLFGCEVWRGLDWLVDEDKTVQDVSLHQNLAASLNGVFDSQIAGGKRYDKAVEGRRKANATFLESHSVDKATHVQYAIDMSVLILGQVTLHEFCLEKLNNFQNDVLGQLGAIGSNKNNAESLSSEKMPLQRWKMVWGATLESLALYRIWLGGLLILELILRFRYLHPFYTDEGTLPLRLLMPTVDGVYKAVCLHCHFGQEWQQGTLLSFQLVVACFFTAGVATNVTAFLSWYLYLSLTLRNTWMNYILDRYFHYLLFLSIFLPLGERYTIHGARKKHHSKVIAFYPAILAMKLLVFWIYLDAGGGKWMDEKKGWTFGADPLPALDTYARHTLAAQYMYALLGPWGLRLLTPVVVYVEIFAAPVASLGNYLSSNFLVYTAVGLICALHFGIALMLRNAALLSFVACSPWWTFLPIGLPERFFHSPQLAKVKYPTKLVGIVSTVLIVGLAFGTVWLATLSSMCDQSVKHIWSTVLHNRWNVFVGAEEYVSWEIAPGLLVDGSVVDVWSKSQEVSWEMPGTGAPCTSTSRPGRWRSFPYLAELQGEDAYVLWHYLCDEWDRENQVNVYPERKLVKYNFFMLQADVLVSLSHR
jgi:LmbE family N-acetylglucosaminyl deacetylase